VNKREGAAQKHVGAAEKMMMTPVTAAAKEALVIAEASMMVKMTKEAGREVKGALQASATMNIIR
jgi:hypothetical protein